MIEFRQTETFRRWRIRLKDERIRALIASRLDRLAFGNPGDVKPVGHGISELRIDHGRPRLPGLLQEARQHHHSSSVRRDEEHAGE